MRPQTDTFAFPVNPSRLGICHPLISGQILFSRSSRSKLMSEQYHHLGYSLLHFFLTPNFFKWFRKRLRRLSSSFHQFLQMDRDFVRVAPHYCFTKTVSGFIPRLTAQHRDTRSHKNNYSYSAIGTWSLRPPQVGWYPKK